MLIAAREHLPHAFLVAARLNWSLISNRSPCVRWHGQVRGHKENNVAQYHIANTKICCLPTFDLRPGADGTDSITCKCQQVPITSCPCGQGFDKTCMHCLTDCKAFNILQPIVWIVRLVAAPFVWIPWYQKELGTAALGTVFVFLAS